ncbi:Auxilin-related protein 2 [Platanthera zijinensis]|uniref:Auxilin-related protein 2 n=1 Tax=Platanthera zijinensis TaxID=2320716 RepID=A0AAP0G3Z8_9ASPA
MDEVADILSVQYGIRQGGMSAPMAASKPSNIATIPAWIDRSSSSALSSSNNDCALEILGMRLMESKGIGFEELLKGGNRLDDPFLIFETDFPSSDQFSLKTNGIHPSYVDGNDFFDISGGIGRSTSSFPLEKNENVGKSRTPGVDGNPRNVQKPLKSSFLDSNPNSTTPKPPIFENFEFLSMYDTATDQKEVPVTGTGEEENKSYNGIDDFLSGIGLGGSWPPRQMESTSDNIFDSPFETQGPLGRFQGVSTPSYFNINESSSMKHIVHDLSFGIQAIQSHTKLHEVEGDNDYRRRARYEREMIKFARAERALAEKNERDFNVQREQNEKEIFSEELDNEIKQWAAGREGNLRALLSTLHDILWPECGWQPISLGNLMTSSAVKKAYGKAALCIHPDKVQQKRSNLRQKYVAEKVFYLLTEALNKFSSEEIK